VVVLVKKYVMRTNHETEGTVHFCVFWSLRASGKKYCLWQYFWSDKRGPIALSNHTKFTDINMRRRVPLINKHSIFLLASQFLPTHIFGT